MRRIRNSLLFLVLGVLPVWLSACGDSASSGSNPGNSPNYTISLSSSSITAAPGGSATTQLTLTPQNGFTGTVSLSLVSSSGAAVSGITLSPATVNVGGSNPVNQTLTVSVATGVAANTYSLKVRASSGSLTKEANLTLIVQSGPSFTISLNPTSLTATQGESRTIRLTLTRQNNFTGTVSLSLVNPPAGVTISPTSLNVGSSDVQRDLTLSTTTSTPVGQHTLTLKAASGSIERTATVTLVVNQVTTFNVNTTADTIDADPGNGQCADSNGNCSIRAAVMEANALGSSVIINIPAGTYTLTRSSSIDEQGDDLDLRTTITLRGADRDTTILDGNDSTRLVQVHEGRSARIENLTIQRAGNGAAVWNYGGALVMERVTLRNNRRNALYQEGWSSSTALQDVLVQSNGTESNYDGVYVSSGSLSMNNVAVTGNARSGIGAFRANLTLSNVTVSSNGDSGVVATGDFFGGSTATLLNVTVSGNGGSGVYNYGTATLLNVTVSGNGGSGVYNYGTATLTNVTVSGNGGSGIYNIGTATLTNVTVSGNSTTSSYGGGGIYNWGTLNLAFSTIVNNTAPRGGGMRIGSGTVRLKGVILANNTATGGIGPECEGSLVSNGYNLIRSNTDCSFTRDSTDILNQDPSLGSLADNGGFVQTHLPLVGSPVLDRVPASACTDLSNNPLATDARGIARPQNGGCDLGAVERN
ncbi:right-handed parallel beta-helix repeat-containing protein [Meiothermus sp. QL-1]|uniref:right-handed parallel beta-helix repeat-containing protein n=1 Tax=Meiothermus sp. QL-1 TaxID=2058095 RepID=UPI000E09FE65|nr:right-handed parallel beta-helix repeat-containing protein [Meiothermus sp. QL-1]RDI94490.1 right-handed parallel beta-helix repeat-containing protein [Meiothermus sp. QL-1]